MIDTDTFVIYISIGFFFMLLGIQIGRIMEKGLEERGGQWDWYPSSLARLLDEMKRKHDASKKRNQG